jgi:D-serine deaminase-like pyridoxal phosphate-dependent protein
MPGFGATAPVWRPGEHLPLAHSRSRTRTRDLLARHGIDCPTVTGAGTDARLKALAFDSGPPIVCDEPAATYERASDEHGRLGISGATNRLQIGDKIHLVPGHCDPTVNLYDWYVGIRANRVEQLWRITARGAVY